MERGTSRFIRKMRCDTLYTFLFVLVVVNFFPESMGNRFMGVLAWLLAAGLLIWFLSAEYKTFSNLYLKVKKAASKNPAKSVCWVFFITGAVLSLSVNAYRLADLDGDYFKKAWTIKKNKQGNATIDRVWDEDLTETVVLFSGADKNMRFRFRPSRSVEWQAHPENMVQWMIQSSGSFQILVRLDTNHGRRYLRYLSDDTYSSGKKRKRVVSYGLGKQLADGRWHTVQSNFQADLAKIEPEIIIEKIRWLEVRNIKGNARFQDKGLLKSSGWIDFNKKLGITLMLSALACYSFVFIAYFMFDLSWKQYAAPALILMGIVHLIPVWQFIDYDSSAMMLAYTVARDALNEHRIMSVFRNTTSYGPFAAVVAIYFWGRFMAGRYKLQHRYVDGLIAVLATSGCFLAGSRTGIVALFAGLAVLFFYVPGRKKTALIALGAIAVIALHVLAVYNPYLGKKMGKVFPYVNKITQPQTIERKDFVPDLTAGYAGKKVNRWIRIEEAFAFWQQAPLVGIGLGQYNLKSGHKWVGNVHNVFMNILCEAGVLVFLPLLGLAVIFVWERRNSFMMAVLASLFVVSVFENLFDHTLSLNLTCAWMFARES